jgi:hypothetical protein
LKALSQSDPKAHFWTFGHSVCAQRASTRVPTQITCRLIKERPGRLRARGSARFRAPLAALLPRASRGGGKYSRRLHSVNTRTYRGSPPPLCSRGAARRSRGAQYSGRLGVVNASHAPPQIGPARAPFQAWRNRFPGPRSRPIARALP